MRIALVHDDLIQFGGAERLLMAMHNLWPSAPIYTSVASDEWVSVCKEKSIDLRTSFMQRMPLRKKLNRYYAPFLLHVLAFESFDFSDFDIVLSISARFAHGVVVKPPTTHICYMNSPGRMFWEPFDYFRTEKVSPEKLGFALMRLRLWDYAAAQRIDYIIANSTTPQARIKKYYNRDSTIIYPFVDTKLFTGNKHSRKDYFLIISRLNAWKRIDIAIKACNTLKLPLKIIGKGVEHTNLKLLAGPTVEFLDNVSDVEKNLYLQNCVALINTQHEDFGIVPLEAMAAGKPVVAYGQGGVLDTVIPNRTGAFFCEQTVESLSKILFNFDHSAYLMSDCISQANKFDRKYFETNIKEFVDAVYLESHNS